MTHTAASHKGAVQMLWAHLKLRSPPGIFVIYFLIIIIIHYFHRQKNKGNKNNQIVG